MVSEGCWLVSVAVPKLCCVPPPQAGKQVPPAGPWYPVVNCSGRTTGAHVLQELHHHCALHSTNAGRVLRPKVGAPALPVGICRTLGPTPSHAW